MALDPFDMLVRLGKISQANLQAADLVESGVGTSTRAARLVSIGVDKQKLLQDLSELTRMPIASADRLAAVSPMKLPASYSRVMKELLAVPIGRLDEHILDIAIADPRTTTKLRDAAIAHRPHLALESDILAALTRVFPEDDVLDPIAEPTLKNVPIAPRPVSVNDGARAADATDGAPDDAANADTTNDDRLRANEPPPPAASHGAGTRDDDEQPPASLLEAAPDGPLPPPAREKPVSPFAKTAVHTEVTERVRERHRAGDDDDPADAPAATSAPPSLAQRTRVFALAVRERVTQANPLTRAIVAAIAVFTGVIVLAIALATSEDDESANADATSASADAGVAPVVDAGEEPANELATTPPVVEKPKKAKPKPKRKPTRKQRKTQR